MAKLSLDEGLALLSRRTAIVKYTIYAYVATSAVAVLAEGAELAGGVDIENGTDTASQIATAGYLLFFVMMLVSAVIIAMWIYRAHANLRAADASGLTFTPGWAVGWYFIPIANLFKPFQAMRELWSVSHLQADSYASESDPALKRWWGCWVVGSMASNISFRIGNGGGPKAEATALVLDMASTAILIVAAVVLLQIVNAVNAAQQSAIGIGETFA